MRRTVLVIIAAIGLAVGGGLWSNRAQAGSAHGFPTTWCDAPVVVPLTTGTGLDVAAAPAVVTARGTEVFSTEDASGVHMIDRGSRVQVSFDQVLFHTQWLFAGIDPGDAIRVDATIDQSPRQITATSVRGGLEVAAEQGSRGLLTVAKPDPAPRGEIDVFVGATEVMFTNESDGPIQLIGAIGCPALSVSSKTLSQVSWNEEAQRFIAEYEVRFSNRLANTRTSALRFQEPDMASSIIDDLAIDFDLRADGFSSARIDDIELSAALETRRNDSFDGVFDSALLETPLRLDRADEQSIRLVVAYEPNFDDPAWSDAVAAPEPLVGLRGRVDDLPVSVIARLRSDGVEIDTDAKTLSSPAAELTVAHEMLQEPRSDAQGVVSLSERITVENTGATALRELVVEYSIAELFGEGTRVVEMAGVAAGSCADGYVERFNGVNRAVVAYDASGLAVGETCTVDLRSRVVPGRIPTATGERYESAVTASTRSGLRDVRDAAAVRTTIAQDSSASLEMSKTAVTNLRDGRYRFSGDMTITNTGDQQLGELFGRIDVQNAASGEVEPFEVVFENLAGTDDCPAVAPPSRARSGGLITSGGALAPGASCVVSFSVIARPYAALDDWSIVGFATSRTPRGITLEVGPTDTAFALAEAPAVDVEVAVGEVTNASNGNYVVEIETTMANTGDVPFVAASAGVDATEVFGSTLVSLERTVDTCAQVAWSDQLASTSPPATCVVTERAIVAPGAELTGWEISGAASATSTSGAEVTGSSSAAVVEFTEAPSASTELELLAMEKVDDRTFRYRLVGRIENTGDIEVRNVVADLGLGEIFGGSPITVERVGADGLTISDRFDGSDTTALLTGQDTVPVDTIAAWDMTFTAATGTDSGPFALESSVRAHSPAGAELSLEAAPIELATPLVRIMDRRLNPSNNNDGTYSLTHRVEARNVGEADLPAIEVTTDFAWVFRDVVVGEVERESTCASGVAAGVTCALTETAVLRPGSAVGPYAVSVDIAAVTDDGVSAAVVSEPQTPHYQSKANSPIYFEEAPSIELASRVGEPENLGDGTYRVGYEFDVVNTGDVPLYRVTTNNPTAVAYGDNIVSNIIVADGCAEVRFAAPLGPDQTCTLQLDSVVRPLDALGPWTAPFDVIAESPSFAKVLETVDSESVTFEESVGVEASTTVSVRTNNGDGTYNVDQQVEVVNVSDVPLVGVEVGDTLSSYQIMRSAQRLQVDTCGLVSWSAPLAPGETCRVEWDDTLTPGSSLGPHSTLVSAIGTSPSGVTAGTDVESNAITMTEDPALSVTSRVVSVEAVEDEIFRVVTNLDVANTGDVRISDLSMVLDLDEVFPDSVYRVDGVISDDFVVDEAFAARESDTLIESGQSLGVDRAGTVTLVVSVEPDGQPGPFVGELRLEGTSPANAATSTVVDAQIDLPSIAVELVTQSVDNNRDGSYTVTTTYAIENDGSTVLEFVRLNEDLAEIFAGTTVRHLSIDSTDVNGVDLDDRRRGTDIVEWGTSLGAGERAVVTSTVLVTPGNVLGPFQSEVRASAQSPAGTPVASEFFSEEPIEFVEQPALRVEQRLLRRPEWNTTGRFDVTFGIEVVNDGDVELRGLQVREDLLAALGPNARIVVRDIRSDTLTVNEGFDGLGRPPQDPLPEGEGAEEPARTPRDIGDTRVLAGWDTLPAGERASIEIDLTITPETRGVYSTRVIVAARTPAGTGIGSDGEIIEANTLTRLSVQGELGVAKRTLGEARVRPDGSVGVTYEILVENVGPFPLTNVEVHDQLSQAFGIGSTFVTSKVRIEAQSPCAGHASSSYDGGTIDPVLVSRVELAPGEKCRIQYDAAVIPSKPLPGPFRSSAFAIASDPFAGTVIDDSTDGTNVDPDGNQEPGDNDIATAVRLDAPNPSVVMTIEPYESVPAERDGWHDFGYVVTLENTGAIDIDSTQLLAELDDDWDFSYSIVDISSDDLLVNEGFDGDRDTNLIARQNRIRAGDSVEVEVILSSRVPRNDVVPVALTFRADSVTGVEVDVESPRLEIEAARAPAWTASGWVASMSVEEQRLLALGAAAIALFVIVFIFRAVRRIRELLGSGSGPDPEADIDLRVDEPASVDVRDRAHTIELTERADPDEAVDQHHRPRRRRGRRSADRAR